jgi:hypothetical protein
MRPLNDEVRRGVAAEQVEARARRTDLAQHPFVRNWSPAVAVGLLALSILMAVTWIVTFFSAMRLGFF